MAFLPPAATPLEGALGGRGAAGARGNGAGGGSAPARCRLPSRRRGSAGVRMVVDTERDVLSRVGASKLDWQKLGFSYVPTNSYVRVVHRDGEWGAMETVSDPYIKVHVGATSLHYGQSCFEGLKAFAGEDGRVRLFRPDENARRLHHSSERLVMPQVSEQMFIEACKRAVRENIDFVPPYGVGGALYVRPLLIGSGPRIGLQPADEYTFLVLVTSVGNYYKGGLEPVTALVQTKYDRAAPLGIGDVKVGGNYAADLLPFSICKSQGYPINLYLDAYKHETVEEFGTSNFIGIKGNSYVTPDSASILRSITNKSLMTLAEEMGLKVEQRTVALSELEEFDEVAACGTAVVITPVTRFVTDNRIINIGNDPKAVGDTLRKLYDRVRSIQNAEAEDKYGWMYDVLE